MPSQDRPELHREAIIASAVALADAEGLDALSMRRLAQTVGCAPMSLYNHVDDKDDVHAAMVEQVLAGRTDGPVGEGWRPALRHIALDLHRVVADHLWVSQLWTSAFPGPRRTALMEDVLRTLREGGFSPRLAHHAFHAIDLFVMGSAHQELTFTLEVDDMAAAAQAFVDQTPADTYPFVLEHVDQHTSGALDGEDGFAFVLDLLLDGFERARQQD